MVSAGQAVGITLLVLTVIGLVWVINGAWTNWQVELQYQREVGKYFEYADRASDAPTKLAYFNQYVNALKANDLTNGASSVYYQNQPNALLEDNFKVALSLQKRLIELNQTDPHSMAYQQGIQEISHEEFCWFPHSAFYQGYALKHGAWGESLWPVGTTNDCAPSKD